MIRVANEIGDGVTWPDRFLMISIMVTCLILAAWGAS